MNSFLKYNLPSFIWAAVILWLSLSSGSNLPKINIPNIDKVVHFTFYFILAPLMFYGWSKQNSLSSLHQNSFIKIFIIAFAYGFAIEIMQGLFTATRHFEVLDIVANSSGAIAGSLISAYLSRKLVL